MISRIIIAMIAIYCEPQHPNCNQKVYRHCKCEELWGAQPRKYPSPLNAKQLRWQAELTYLTQRKLLYGSSTRWWRKERKFLNRTKRLRGELGRARAVMSNDMLAIGYEHPSSSRWEEKDDASQMLGRPTARHWGDEANREDAVKRSPKKSICSRANGRFSVLQCNAAKDKRIRCAYKRPTAQPRVLSLKQIDIEDVLRRSNQCK